MGKKFLPTITWVREDELGEKGGPPKEAKSLYLRKGQKKEDSKKWKKTSLVIQKLTDEKSGKDKRPKKALDKSAS